jgi:hypothetical protein
VQIYSCGVDGVGRGTSQSLSLQGIAFRPHPAISIVGLALAKRKTNEKATTNSAGRIRLPACCDQFPTVWRRVMDAVAVAFSKDHSATNGGKFWRRK